MSAQLHFEVKHQIITRIDKFQPVADSKNYLYAHFDFLTDDWNGVITVIFTKNDISYQMVLNENNECGVPWELLTEEGNIYVSCFCGDLVTTSNSRIYIRESGYVEDSENTEPPTENIYNQLVEDINTFKENIIQEFSDFKEDVESIDIDITEEIIAFKQELLQELLQDINVFETTVLSNIDTFGTNLISDVNTFKDNLLQNLSIIDGGSFEEWNTEG